MDVSSVVDLIFAKITRGKISSTRRARVIITSVHFIVQAPPATRSFVCHDGGSHVSRKHISCSVLDQISLAAWAAVSPLDESQNDRGCFLNSTSLFVALPKNAIIPQLAVHPNRQVAVLLIVLTFRLFFWGIVPGEFICCDPRSGVEPGELYASPVALLR